jgi:hypothetical protein
MRQRNVILREEGSSIGAVSLLALIVLAGLIALLIWQPWDGLVTVRSTTVTTPLDGTSGTR